MEDQVDKEQQISITARVIAALILFAMFGGIFYCSATIYKGIIREAVIEAIQQTQQLKK